MLAVNVVGNGYSSLLVLSIKVILPKLLGLGSSNFIANEPLSLVVFTRAQTVKLRNLRLISYSPLNQTNLKNYIYTIYNYILQKIQHSFYIRQWEINSCRGYKQNKYNLPVVGCVTIFYINFTRLYFCAIFRDFLQCKIIFVDIVVIHLFFHLVLEFKKFFSNLFSINNNNNQLISYYYMIIPWIYHIIIKLYYYYTCLSNFVVVVFKKLFSINSNNNQLKLYYYMIS